MRVSNEMRVSVVGYMGVIGGALYDYLLDLGHDVTGVDKAHKTTKLKDVLDTDICFICVPTPSTDDGSCDTSIVEDVIHGLRDHIGYSGIVVIRSTVTPGTTQRLSEKYVDYNEGFKIYFMPEFLREHSREYDIRNEQTSIIGIPEHSNGIHRHDLGCLSHCFYNTKLICLRSDESEFLKYFHNTLNATKVTFANVFHDLMRDCGAEYYKMFEAYKRLGNNVDYLKVNEGLRGFSGPCLPKDTKALRNIAIRSSNSKANMFFSDILLLNSKFPKTVIPGMREE